MLAKSCLALLALASPACADLAVRGIKAHSELEPFDVVFDVALNGDSPETASFTVRVHPEWAPLGAAQFKKLVEQGWYDGAGVFRVVPGFVAQFGLPAKAQPELPNIMDDPVTQRNSLGTLVFATSGPNTRTSQLFINKKDNSFLDGQGFSPFAEVLGDGMDVVERFFKGYGEKPDQTAITREGDSYLHRYFPKMTKFTKVTIQAALTPLASRAATPPSRGKGVPLVQDGCPQWCARSAKDWSLKCQWAGCKSTCSRCR